LDTLTLASARLTTTVLRRAAKSSPRGTFRSDGGRHIIISHCWSAGRVLRHTGHPEKGAPAGRFALGLVAGSGGGRAAGTERRSGLHGNHAVLVRRGETMVGKECFAYQPPLLLGDICATRQPFDGFGLVKF